MTMSKVYMSCKGGGPAFEGACFCCCCSWLVDDDDHHHHNHHDGLQRSMTCQFDWSGCGETLHRVSELRLSSMSLFCRFGWLGVGCGMSGCQPAARSLRQNFWVAAGRTVMWNERRCDYCMYVCVCVYSVIGFFLYPLMSCAFPNSHASWRCQRSCWSSRTDRKPSISGSYSLLVIYSRYLYPVGRSRCIWMDQDSASSFASLQFIVVVYCTVQTTEYMLGARGPLRLYQRGS